MKDISPNLLVEGDTCWRVETADRISLIVNGADYFAALRTSLRQARHQVMLIGWDFDFEIEMLPGQSDTDGLAPDGLPNRLGAFLEAIVDASPDLHLHLLKWNGAVIAAPARIWPSLGLRVTSEDRMHFALDGHHPFGACHHQKIVVLDDVLAFCGGIDITEQRWDTAEHRPGDPRRIHHDGSPAGPWHDAAAALSGPAAQALGTLARTRWSRATGENLSEPIRNKGAIWPESVPVTLSDTPVGIARTMPPFDTRPLVNEIERLYLTGIEAARDWIFIESQYLTASSLIDALEARLRDPDGPELLVINPMAARGAFENAAMHTLRGRAIDRLRAVGGDRVRLLYPVNAADDPIYVHAKILIADDKLLHLGSSNIDDRSMGFDTECDIAFEGRDDDSRTAIMGFLHRLLAEHIATTPADVADAIGRANGLIAVVDLLNPSTGARLVPIDVRPESAIEAFLAETRLLDPRFHPGEPTRTGQGLRPRHIVLAGLAVVGLAAAWHFTRRDR